MNDFDALWQMVLSGAASLFLVFLTAFLKQLSEAIRKKYLTDAEKVRIENLEATAKAAVIGAEQKLGDITKLVNNVVGDAPGVLSPEYAEWLKKWEVEYEKYVKLSNAEKKQMVINILKDKFPDAPVQELDMFLERAYREFKEEKLQDGLDAT